MTLIISLSIIVLIGCSKSTITNSAKSPVGKWNWISTYYDYPLSDSNPKTPQNTGIRETLIFNADNSYKHLKNNVTIDSGTYSFGHGIYTNLSNSQFVYDSILYYHKSIPVVGGVDYYEINNDSLNMSSYLADKWFSYSNNYFGGSVFFKKQ